MSASRDFWLTCGHHLLDRDATGNLLVTDEFLKAYLARPELVPPTGACAAERGLHNALLFDPRRPVAASQVAAIIDADARDNWETMIAWRDHLVKHRTLEAAYLAIVRRNIKFPHILIGQLVQAILRNALDDCDDAFMLRAAEMFFRPQKLIIGEGSVVAVDEENESLLDRRPRSPLVELLGLPAPADVDHLDDATAGSYWDARLSWYVGLSSDATRIGDAIWNGDELSDAMRAQLIGLFRLTFRDPADMIEKVRREPVYLLVAMAPDEVLRLKPQNLVTGLPIRDEEAVN